MLQYTREQLLECRQAAPAAIPRRTRKVLFTFRLWRPRSVRVHAHLSRRNADLTKVKVNAQEQQSRLHARQLRLATLNAFSVRNKSAALSAALTDHDLDVFLLTESWHEQQDDLAVRMVCPPGYKSVDAPRSSSAVGRRKQRGGGIVLLHKEGIAAKRLTFSAQPTTFELLGAQMTFAGSMVVLIGVYRPGGESVASEFFDELSAVLEQLAAYSCPVVVTGDLNLHIDVVGAAATHAGFRSSWTRLDCSSPSLHQLTGTGTYWTSSLRGPISRTLR